MKKTEPENLLEFPCQYQFKAVGLAGDRFRQSVINAVSKHAVVCQDAVMSRPSGKGTYQSVSILVTLYNYRQLTDIYAEMRLSPDLKMLL